MQEKEGNEDEIIEVKDDKNALLTEYQVINQWRNNVVHHDYTITSISLPLIISSFSLATSNLFSYIFAQRLLFNLMWGIVLFAFTILLILCWRVYAQLLDNKIVSTYSRIIELEEKFSFCFTYNYLKAISLWWKKEKKNQNKSWSPSYQEVRNKIDELKWWHKWFSRGHGMFNIFCIVLIVISVIMIIISYNIIPKVCLRNFITC